MSRWPVPESWIWSKAEEIADIIGGGTPDSGDAENFCESGIPWLTPNDLSGYEGTYISRGRRGLTEKGLRESSARVLPPGSILFSSRAPIGYCAIASNAITTNQGFKSLILRDELDPRFVRYYLLSAKSYAQSLASGSTFKELSGSRLAELLIPVAPAAEQIRIANAIDSALQRSRAGQTALEEAKQRTNTLRQSILAAAFSGDLTADWREKNPDVEPASVLLDRIRKERRERWEEAEFAKISARTNTPVKDGRKQKYVDPKPADPTGLPDLPTGWTWAAVGETSTVTTGSTPPTRDSRYYEPGVVPFFKPSDLDAGYHTTDAIQKVSVAGAEMVGPVPPMSVLVTCIGATIGKTALIRQAGICNQQINVAVTVPTVLSEWLFFWLMSVQGQRSIVDNASATTLPILNKGRFERLPVPVASLGEQRAAIERIEHAFACAATISNRTAIAREQLNELEQAILSKAFRGELVSQDPNDEPASALLDRIRAQREPESSRGRSRRSARDLSTV